MRFGCCPAATSTIIVSPIAREMASTNEAMIPETAAGTTMRVATCIFVEPSAYAPSRRSRGTLRHRVLGERRDGRDQHHAHHEPRRERVEDLDVDPDVAQQRRHEREREVAEDDRRDAGQDLERRLEDLRARAGAAYSLR